MRRWRWSSLGLEQVSAPGLTATPLRTGVTLAIAVALVGREIWHTLAGWTGPSLLAYWTERWVITLLAVGALLVVAGGKPGALGLTLRPRQGWRPWVRITAIVAVVVCVVGAPVGLALSLSGVDWQRCDLVPLGGADLVVTLGDSVVHVPLIEELIYRVVVCTALAAVFGPRAAVVLSAALFALSHWHVPAPTNLIAGFAFGWGYLRSGTLAIPLLWHASGNLVVWLFNLGCTLLG